MTFLYVQDDLELARRGQDTPIKDAQAEVATRAEDARAKQETVTEAHAKTATMNQSRAGLQGQLTKSRAELHRFSTEKTEDALTHYATANHTANARAFGQINQRIAWISMALTTCDSLLMPAQILAQRRAEAICLRSVGNLLTASAIEAAVERHAASKALLETDGVVTLGASGRAHEILMRALEFHRRASESDKIIHAEETRLLLIQAAERTV